MQFKPHEYQKTVIDHILKHKASGVFLGMGLGKTALTLFAILKEMYETMNVQKTLIIAPKKVAEATWQDEMQKWDCFKNLTVSTVLGTQKEREAALKVDADIYITNRDNVKWLFENQKIMPEIDLLVIDESSSFKNSRTQRFRALRKMRMQFKKIILLTGTPSPNSLMDLWAQIYLLDGGKRLGRTLTEYRNNYFLPDKRNAHVIFSYKVRSKAAEQEIYDKISDICISLKAEDFNIMPDVLPPVEVPIVLPKKVQKKYKEMALEYVSEFKDKEITATSAAAVANKLLQIANGAIYDENKKTVEIHQEKIKALEEIVENNESVLVFYNFIHDKDRIMKAIPDAVELKSAQNINMWNRGKIKILLAHPASAGYGLNLQAGGHVIVWFGLTWSLEQYLQANARLARQGQTEPVVIHHLIAKGTIDERVIKAIERKEKGQNAMLDAVKCLIKKGRMYDR